MSQQTCGGMVEQGFCADTDRRGNRCLPALFRIDGILGRLDLVQIVNEALLIARSGIPVRCDALVITPKTREFRVDGLSRHCRNLLFERINPPPIADLSELDFDRGQFRFGLRSAGGKRDRLTISSSEPPPISSSEPPPISSRI
jgi:hypothetical protein